MSAPAEKVIEDQGDVFSHTEINTVREGYARGAPIPWQIKMGLKVFLASLPMSYDFWVKLGIFKHGDTGIDVKTLYDGVKDHYSYYKEQYGHAPEQALELGPGDSVGHCLAAKAMGGKGLWSIDAGDFASKEPAHYKAVYDYLKDQGYDFGEAPATFERETVLAYTGSRYGIEGIHSMPDVPDASIDFSFSHAVFEHIRRDEFGPYMKELFRVQKPGSLGRHYVDLHDHLGGALNNMRFKPSFWEGKAVGRAGFYTNRLTMKEMISFSQEAGFRVVIKKYSRWANLPTPKQAMNKLFKDKPEEELNVCTFVMLLYKD